MCFAAMLAARAQVPLLNEFTNGFVFSLHLSLISISRVALIVTEVYDCQHLHHSVSASHRVPVLYPSAAKPVVWIQTNASLQSGKSPSNNSHLRFKPILLSLM